MQAKIFKGKPAPLNSLEGQNAWRVKIEIFFKHFYQSFLAFLQLAMLTSARYLLSAQFGQDSMVKLTPVSADIWEGKGLWSKNWKLNTGLIKDNVITEKEVGEMENSTYCLGTALSLEPGQEEDILVLLEGEWREDTVVSRHPDFDEPNIKVVGEVAEGGDHMYVSFKNLSDHPVTIKENTTVVQLFPRNQGDCIPSLCTEELNRTTSEADHTVGGIQSGIFVKKCGSKQHFYFNSQFHRSTLTLSYAWQEAENHS